MEIKIPSPGESITEVEIGKWLVKDGEMVDKDQEIAEIESDKATFSLSASIRGRIKILQKEGERVTVGSVACKIETEDESEDEKEAESKDFVVTKPETEEAEKNSENTIGEIQKNKREETESDIASTEVEGDSKIKTTAAARAVMDEEGISMEDVLEGVRRLTKKDVETAVKSLKIPVSNSRDEERSAMSPLRRKLSQRLVAVKNETAMLTTFNEIDMFRLMELRTKYQKSFTEKFGYKLGYMSFFSKAASIALQLFPNVNSMIDGEEIITPHYQDIGIAVQTEKGLMVPIIRDAGIKNIPELEKEIMELAERARNKKLTIPEMTGGTFTITNGGLFGSLLSTPIINPPQSAILGMHAIKERPVAIDKKIEIRPMMYVALTYDHRLIDGKDSVSFLVKIKEMIENPVLMVWGGRNPEDILMGL